MATFPTLDTLEGSTITAIDGQQVDVMESGEPRITNYADTIHYRASLRFRLNEADTETLMSFYTANRNVSFTYSWPGEGTGGPWNTTYTMRFAAGFYPEPIGNLWQSSVEMIGVAD